MPVDFSRPSLVLENQQLKEVSCRLDWSFISIYLSNL